MKHESKSKGDKTKTEKTKILYEEESMSNECIWSAGSEDDNHMKEITIDESKMEEIENTRKDDDAYFNDKSNLDVNFGDSETKQDDQALLLEIENNTSSKDFLNFLFTF